MSFVEYIQSISVFLHFDKCRCPLTGTDHVLVADTVEVSIFVTIYTSFKSSYENIASQESVKFRDRHERALTKHLTLSNSGVENNVTSVTLNVLR